MRRMSLSLREQLLAAGLGTKKKAKQIEHEQRREAWRKPDAAAAEQQKREAAHAQAQAAKAAKDQALNQKRKEEAERRARWAEIRQLVEQNAIARPADGEDCFNFIDRGKVRRIYATAEHKTKIIDGSLVLVRCEGRYHLVLPEIAARIGEREPRAVVTLSPAPAESAPAEDDPYKDFVVPDDLKW
jgi:uncharacterized protein YaiL (DUF2058 family)